MNAVCIPARERLEVNALMAVEKSSPRGRAPLLEDVVRADRAAHASARETASRENRRTTHGRAADEKSRCHSPDVLESGAARRAQQPHVRQAGMRPSAAVAGDIVVSAARPRAAPPSSLPRRWMKPSPRLRGLENGERSSSGEPRRFGRRSNSPSHSSSKRMGYSNKSA